MKSRATWDHVVLAVMWAPLLLAVLAWWAAPVARRGADPLAPLLGVWLAAAVLLGTTWWLKRDPASATMAAALGLAAATPLAVVPLVASGNPFATLPGLTVAAVAVLPLGWILSGRTGNKAVRWFARTVTVVGVTVAIAVPWVATGNAVDWSPSPMMVAVLRWLILLIAVSVPAAIVALGAVRAPQGTRPSRMVQGLWVGAIGLAASVTGVALVVPSWPMLIGPILAVVGTAIFLGRFAIRPLEAEAGAATVQRDLVVSASEAERYRLATALHDGPLGDLALLVQRLDVAGDTENASLTRSIAADLRALGNDLRVPILEDLGAGPAIEWLAERVSERADTTIEVRLDALGRPPAEVELATYRIAQEALLNAVKHGHGPVTVSYVAQPDAMSLTVADSGPGLEHGAPGRALQEGRLGLLLMKQRAEAIGARLSLSLPHAGGTRVGLTWAAPAR